MDQNGALIALRNLLPQDGELYYHPTAFSSQEADLYFAELSSTVRWQQQPIKIFGREIMQPRLTAWFGDSDKPYTYSGLTMVPLPWTETLSAIRTRIQDICAATFTSVLLNLYRDGNDHMGWHRDNEKVLGPEPFIASVSFGAVRSFELRPYKLKVPRISIEAGNGSLILMKGATQQYWEHRLPKKAQTTGVRINLTFRRLV